MEQEVVLLRPFDERIIAVVGPLTDIVQDAMLGKEVGRELERTVLSEQRTF